MEGRRLVFGGRGGEEGFGVGGEVLAAVRRIEAFGEDDEGGSCLGGFEDFGACVGEVDGLVSTWRWMDGWISLVTEKDGGMASTGG